VPLSVAPLPSVSEEELMGESGLDLASLYKRSGGVDMSVLVSYLEDRLSLANNDVSKVTPPWVQETWQMLITELDAFSPDVLVFANARDETDRLLLTAAKKLAKKPPKTVMELPNLYPKVDMAMVDVVVAPSTFAAQHHSVVSQISKTPVQQRPEVRVITPGVDLDRWDVDVPGVSV
jgi:hypothetical protein